MSSEAIPDVFYILAAATCILITVRILVNDSSPANTLLLIFVFSLILRSTFWFSTSVTGQDSIYHMGIIGWIIETGDFLPDKISYYSNYPAAHHFAAVGAIIMGLSNRDLGELKLGTFLTLSFAQTLGILFSYCITSRLVSGERIPLLGALVFGISTGPMIMGANPIAQSVATTLVAGVIWILTTSPDKRIFLIFILLSFVAVITHNLAPIVIAGTSIVVVLSRRIVHWSGERETSNHLQSFPAPDIFTVFLIGITGIYYWIQVGYFRYQVVRVATIISFTGTGSDAISSTNAAEPPQIEVFNYVLPGVLMWAAQLLVLIILVGLGIWIVLDIHIRDQKKSGKLPDYWTLVTVILFGLFAVAYAIGGSGPVTRSLPTVTLVVIPLVAFGLMRLMNASQVGSLLGISLVCAVLASSILMPGLAYPSREPGDFRPMATENEVSGVIFVHKYVPGRTSADSYISNYDYWNQVAKGNSSGADLEPLYNHSNLSSSKNYINETSSKESLIFRKNNDEVFEIHPPKYWSKVYNSDGEKESGIYLPK